MNIEYKHDNEFTKVLKNARWIWIHNREGKDEYGEFYAPFLAEKFNDNYLPENIEVKDIYEILKNGATNWHQFAWYGSGLIYNEAIANTLLTPSQRKRITQADTFNGYHLLDLEADALTYASARVYKWAKKFANKK